jgi:hypothetical protein
MMILEAIFQVKAVESGLIYRWIDGIKAVLFVGVNRKTERAFDIHAASLVAAITTGIDTSSALTHPFIIVRL